MLAANFPLWDLFLTTLWVALFAFWLLLVFQLLADIMRSHDLSGPQKAGWVIGILVLPFLGTLFYLVVRGGSMHERDRRTVQTQQAAFEEYIRRVANSKE